MLGVLVRSVLLALLAYGLLLAGGLGVAHWLLGLAHWPGWLAALLGVVGVAALAVWLFLPTVLLIAMLYTDRIAAAVDRRHYPSLPPPRPAPLAAQMLDGLSLAWRVLLLNLLALAVALLPVPGVGLALALLITGWAFGRGLFVAVAMRRMGWQEALALYRQRRLAVLLPGVALAAAAWVPGLNLLVPLVGTAAMVHVLNRRSR